MPTDKDLERFGLVRIHRAAAELKCSEISILGAVATAEDKIPVYFWPDKNAYLDQMPHGRKSYKFPSLNHVNTPITEHIVEPIVQNRGVSIAESAIVFL